MPALPAISISFGRGNDVCAFRGGVELESGRGVADPDHLVFDRMDLGFDSGDSLSVRVHLERDVKIIVLLA